MREQIPHTLVFLIAAALGGGMVAALTGIGVGETVAIVCGWIVFLALGTAFATALSRRHRHHG